jgi:bacteriorhodopsin
MRLILVLALGVIAGLVLANGGPSGVLEAMHSANHSSWLPLGLRGTAVVAFGLTMAVLVLLTVVSEGGHRRGEISTVVPSLFAFCAFFFGMTFWLFA